MKVSQKKASKNGGRGARLLIAALGRNLYRGGPGPPLGRILGRRTPPGLHFKAFWRVPGSRFPMVFAAPCALLPHAFF